MFFWCWNCNFIQALKQPENNGMKCSDSHMKQIWEDYINIRERNNCAARYGVALLTRSYYTHFPSLPFHCFRVNDEEVRLMLWDTAGQEEFDAITKAYYRGKTPAAVALVHGPDWLLEFGFLWGFMVYWQHSI